jgi:NADH:ubiquinone oxidoreductase subunit 4 (subunit M)
LFSSIIFFTFAVKLPVYGLHFWLPIAHVEAPTFGSMVLAGVLLKLGGVGLIRFSRVLSIPLLKQFYVGYLFLFLSYVTIVCCLQSDFKRLVAYSSVSHIIGVPIMLFSSTFVGLKGILSLMFLHGIRSPLMFILVGLVYGLTQTRQHLFIRGLIVSSPLIGLVLVLSFFFTLSAPPYPSFLSELFLAMTRLAL